MYVGVELPHRWTGDRGVTQWLPFPTVDDSGKVSVGEVRQDDLAFRMNASSGKVLKEVWFGLLIMEPDKKGVGSKEVDALEQRGFWDGVDLLLGAIEAD